MKQPLTKLASEGLRQLWLDSQPSAMSRRSPFPGAIGRAGTTLVKLGLARNLGRHVYAGNVPRMGERPDAYVKFELTSAGRKAAWKLLSNA